MFQMPSCLSHIAAGVVAAVMLVMQATPANAGETTQNLLINGDAELRLCTNDWDAQTSVPKWRVLRGAASVLCYSAFGLAGETPVLPKNLPAGQALFGAPGADTEMEQVVDVAAAAAAIDRGTVGFHLSGWLGGWRDRPERATLTAVFVDGEGKATGAPVVIADADAQARNNVTGLVARQIDGLVPVATRRIVVTVQFLSGMASFHNAYADNLSLTLDGDVHGLVPAAAIPAPSRVPTLDHVYVLMMENTNYADVFHVNGTNVTVDARMPFVASLADKGVVLNNMWATYHPSDQNYVAMIAGNTFVYGPVYYPDFDLSAPHLGDLLDARGKRWKGYVQFMGTPCNLNSVGQGRASFSPDDEPFAQFQDVIGDPVRCDADLRDLADFKTAIAGNTLPDFAWLAADNWWDGEGAWYENYDVGYSNAKQDEFLRSTLQPLIESAAWRDSRSLLILTWDEADGWGWPDNHIPTILVGSPGLLKAGTVLREHVDGYDLLRTIESALGLPDLGQFDTFGVPVNDAFTGAMSQDRGAEGRLWPTPSVATRGSIADTFGTATTSAAVQRGEPITMVLPAGADAATVVDIEPLGQVPTAASMTYAFERDGKTASIPSEHLAPGVYGVWLRHGVLMPNQAPMMVTVLPPPMVSPQHPGVEIVGASASGGDPTNVGVRYGANPIVHYCLPPGASIANSWIGIFATGTPNSQLTQANANVIGYWLKTPGGGGAPPPCGDAEAYVSELSPGQPYEVLLLQNNTDGTSRPVGRSAALYVIPALPN
jgi:Phosphoesterase family